MKNSEIKYSFGTQCLLISSGILYACWTMMVLWNLLLPIVFCCVVVVIIVSFYSAIKINGFKRKLDISKKEYSILKNLYINKCRQITEFDRDIGEIQKSFDRIKKSSEEKNNVISYYFYLSLKEKEKSEEFRKLAELYKRKFNRKIRPGLFDSNSDIEEYREKKKIKKERIKRTKSHVVIKKRTAKKIQGKSDERSSLSANSCSPVSTKGR